MKLPKPIKRGETFRICHIREKRYSCTRDTEKECEQWAVKLLELKTGKAQEESGIKPHYPFSQLREILFKKALN
jgi:hypothetical protein